jgi:hypothetical protein
MLSRVWRVVRVYAETSRQYRAAVPTAEALIWHHGHKGLDAAAPPLLPWPDVPAPPEDAAVRPPPPPPEPPGLPSRFGAALPEPPPPPPSAVKPKAMLSPPSLPRVLVEVTAVPPVPTVTPGAPG